MDSTEKIITAIVVAFVLLLSVMLSTFGVTHNTNARNREEACHAVGGAMLMPTQGITHPGCYKVTVQYEPLAVKNYRAP